VLYLLENSPGGHLSLAAQSDVALGLLIFLSLMPLWPAPFPPRPDEGEPQVNYANLCSWAGSSRTSMPLFDNDALENA
jgi:hypothetical protein